MRLDTKKFDYTDLIDMDCKNQTAKLLENYFHRMRNEEYDSIVAVEEETYSEQPFFEFAEHINEKDVFASEFDFETAWMSCGINIQKQSTQ